MLTFIPDIGTFGNPLGWFAACATADLGRTRIVHADELPEPYRWLLVHEGSMTARLERQFGGTVTLDVLAVCAHTDRYARWIVLRDANGRCLELGGVLLDLTRVSATLRAAILGGDEPIGRLLTRHGVAYSSVPKSYFAVRGTTSLRRVMQMRTGHTTFGRCTDLQAGGPKLGEVVEVLPWYALQTWRGSNDAWNGRRARPPELCGVSSNTIRG